MLVTNKSAFSKGLILMASFIGVFIMIFMPVMKDNNGKPQNMLEYSDDLFNKLSKGSSDFSAEVKSGIDAVAGKSVELTVKLKKAEYTPVAAALFSAAGLTAADKGGELVVSGDISKALDAALRDSMDMYKNDGKSVAARYAGQDEKKVMEAWWESLNGFIKPLQKEKRIAESKAVDMTMKKAIEPAYNFYGIEAQRVLDKWAVLTGLLVFYVIYTMWYGFAIFEIFDGIGLSMKKGKKEEV